MLVDVYAGPGRVVAFLELWRKMQAAAMPVEVDIRFEELRGVILVHVEAQIEVFALLDLAV